MNVIRRVASIVPSIMAAAILFLIPLKSDAMEGKLKRFILPNGLEVLVVQDHARKVATLQLWVTVGSADEQESERGISHLIEHMAFKGTERRGVGQIAAEVEALGGDTNAYTSWDETVFHITVPSTATAQGLDILTDAVLRPAIDAQELAKEKQVVIEEILEGEERPERVASKQLLLTAYARSPYRFPIIGTKKHVESFTRDDVLAFRKKWYVPENMFLLIVGDVNPDELRPEIEKLTADLKPVGFFRPPRPQEPVQKEIRSSLIRDVNSRETRLRLAFHIPSMKGDDVNALDLAGDILGARESSRLVRVLKKEKKLVNSISAYAMTPKESGLMVVSATLDAANLEPATKTIVEELTRLAAEPPSEEELERAKTHIESQHVYAAETVEGKARSMGSFRADADDPLYGTKYLRLNSLVTPAQISGVMRRYVANPNVTVTVLMPENGPKDVRIEKLTEIAGGLDKSAKAATPGTAQAAEAVTATFDNGMRVVLVPDDSNPVASVRIALLGGKRFENKETEGIMNFIAQMLDKGTSKLSEVEIARQVDDMGGRLYGFSGYDSFGLSANFFSRNLGNGLKLLAELYTDAAFPAEKMERERALIINRIKTSPDRPVTHTIEVLNGVLLPQHPYGFVKEGTLATVSGFTPADLKLAYERFAVPANTVISIVGDFDPKKTMESLRELFGKIPAKALNAPQVPPEDPPTSVREKVVNIPRAKAHLAVGFSGTTFGNEDRYALDVLTNALAGMGGRLFRQLRDKESLAYTVTSFDRPGLDPGSVVMYMACDVSKVDRALPGLMKQIELVRQKPLGEEELQRSITNLIGTHLISLQSSWSRAETSALNTLYGLGYTYDKEYIKKIGEVKTEDVLRVARKYLDPKRCAVVKILPEGNNK